MISMGKKKCELCCGVARLYCESDQASLCWDCDGKVHGANFLVAKHTRCLLCSACQSHTPWKASGFRLGPTVSICESCLARKKKSSVAGRNQNLNQEIIGCDGGGDRLSREDDGAESYDEESDEDDEEEEEEEVENQVVPAAVAQEAPVVSSSSSVSIGGGDLVVKRTRRDLDLNCSDEENESRPLKRLLKDEASSRSTSSSSSLVSEIANKRRDLSSPR